MRHEKEQLKSRKSGLSGHQRSGDGLVMWEATLPVVVEDGPCGPQSPGGTESRGICHAGSLLGDQWQQWNRDASSHRIRELSPWMCGVQTVHGGVHGAGALEAERL